jgi:hypothetical protein
MLNIIILLALAIEEPMFFTDQITAKVCRSHIATGFKECTVAMPARQAHEYIVKQSKNHKSPWLYSYEKIVTFKDLQPNKPTQPPNQQ